MTRKVWISLGVIALVSGSVLLGAATRHEDDLAFLEQWHPVRESRIGDWNHPGDPAYGRWTVFRFPTNGSPSYSLRTSGKKQLNLEAEFLKRMPGQFRVLGAPYDIDYANPIASADGGPDRYLWVNNSWNFAADRYQVWIPERSWFQRTWDRLRSLLR